MFKALLVKKKLNKKVKRTLTEKSRLRLVNLIRLVTVMLPAEGFGRSSLVATCLAQFGLIRGGLDCTSETSMVRAVMTAVDMKSAPASTVKLTSEEPM